MPLTPDRPIWVVSGSQVRSLNPQTITPDDVGLKAWGLASIPAKWTKPFIVVKADSLPTASILKEALTNAGIDQSHRFIARSSGTREALERRGSFVSRECDFGNLIPTLKELQAEVNKQQDTVHWVIQPLIDVHVKGHLSNERRLCMVHRDWEVEFEAGRGQSSENYRIPLRRWRDGQTITEPDELHCPYRANCVDVLKAVAGWGYERLLRLHFEWVWDGSAVFVVQADECNETNAGVRPIDLVKISHGTVEPAELEIFRVANSDDFDKYRKLANVAIYKTLGYHPVPFYVLDDSAALKSLIDYSECSPALFRDLQKLCERPLVIRTNGDGDMLPRSDELRSAEEARKWLVTEFSNKLRAHPQDRNNFCLIAHNFVPAQASAWCLARPGIRRVRIESLWGIPEGLYWYAHDVFDVDTRSSKIDINEEESPKKLRTSERLRYKGVFVAPDSAGHWVLHETAIGPDWQRSIKNERWIEKIAWDTRRIAEKVHHSVVVMWLVGVPREISADPVMPWFHQEWRSNTATPSAAPRKKWPGESEHIIRTSEDWKTLVGKSDGPNRIERVIVDPQETELIRDQDFAEALGKLAKEKGFVIELAGGILSHAYYMLARTGCRVECADLYATDEENLEFNKLVRDNIPDGIEAQGESVKIVTLKGEALIAALKRKLIEEAFEAADASSAPQIAEELADLYEIADALATRLGINEAEINAAKSKKAKSRGKFDSGVMLVSTSLEPSIAGDRKDGESARSGKRLPHEISRAEELPIERHDVNVDRRRDSVGTREAQITFIIPTYLKGAVPGMPTITLDTPEGEPHKMKLELVVERRGSEIRCRFHLRNQPSQLKLDLPKSS